LSEQASEAPPPEEIERIGPALVGTGDVMAMVSHCWTMCWYAAEGGNRDLAAYYLRRVRGLLRRLAAMKAKYRTQIRDYDRDHLEPAYQALMAGEAAAFRTAFRRGIDQANVYHVETGHPYVVWSLPDRPPESGLRLS
jgi:hypothetical protein